MKGLIQNGLLLVVAVFMLMATAFVLGKVSAVRDYESNLKMCVGQPNTRGNFK